MFDTMMVSAGRSTGSGGALALASRLAVRCHAPGGVVVVDGMMATTADDDPVGFQWSREKADPEWLDASRGGTASAAADAVPPAPDLAFEDRSQPLMIVTRSAEAIAELTERLLPGAPVLLLGPDLERDPSFVDRQPRILVVVEERDPDRSLLAPAFALSQATDGHLTLATVVDSAAAARSSADPDPAFRVAAVQARLDRLAAELREEGASVASLVVTSREPELALLDLVERGRYDVAAISAAPEDGTHRLSPLAAALVRRASKPLLIG